MSTGAWPPRKRATSSSGRTVAERPTRWAGLSRSASRRSRLTARWAPRLPPATACTSSTMTVSTPRRDSRACEVSIRNSDSGVVMRMSGGRVVSLRRSCAVVSPDRTPTSISGSLSSPSRSAAWRMPASGARRLRSTSTPSALSGEMYSTRQRLAFSGTGAVSSRSIDHRNAASVLPDPVGATTSACRPARIASHAPCCAGVGSAKAAANHSRVGSLKRSRTGCTPPVLAHATDRGAARIPRSTGEI